MADLDLGPIPRDAVTVPIFCLFDKIPQMWMREREDGKFVYTTLNADPVESQPTEYPTMEAATAAALRAGGDVKVYAMSRWVVPVK